MRVRVKICGVKSLDITRCAIDAGADAIGLVFIDQSPRQIDVERARQIALSIPPFVASVGLFVDPTALQVREIIRACPLTMLQFQGNEDDAFCAQFGLPFIKGTAVDETFNSTRVVAQFPRARGLHLDAPKASASALPGGSGTRFDWRRFPPTANSGGPSWILAGGLDPNNVGEAIRTTRPFAVDVSSGVESERGVKDAALIKQFIAAVRAVERELANA